MTYWASAPLQSSKGQADRKKTVPEAVKQPLSFLLLVFLFLFKPTYTVVSAELLSNHS